MEEIIICKECNSENAYFDGMLYNCPDCNHEWSKEEAAEKNLSPKDCNGTILQDGDDVTLIKDLKVKGSSLVLKRGAKARGIRLTDNPDEVDCKMDGTAIVLKTCFLKKG